MGLTREATTFKENVATSAMIAASSRWPSPFAVAWCKLEAQSYNSRLDADAKVLLLQDGLKSILYDDDDVVGWGPNDPDGSIWDGKGPRILVRATVRALRSPEETAWTRRNRERLLLNRARRTAGLPSLKREPQPDGPNLLDTATFGD